MAHVLAVLALRQVLLDLVADIALQRAVREAQAAGEIDPGVDPEQLAWELDSLLGGANSGFKGNDGVRAIERGRRAIRDRLSRAATAAAKPLTHIQAQGE